ncbi:hypothetical protein LWI29_036103 [Acer saccharum]|uniref:Pentatricopeptide repeat-containing protein n=1 Tax=Acer saccharum TaxID=4024 RepID=A0AA39RU49_ACESA|nr:hypothetical protein LWI29_036103 [Acer saccharum]
MSFLSRLLRRSFSAATATATATATTAVRRPGSVSADLYRENDLKRLVEKFKTACDNERFRTKSGIYKATVRKLACAKRFKWVEEILEHQKQYNDISSEGFTARLIYLYGSSGMFENAQKVFDEMPERNCKQTVLSFNALLGAYVNSKKCEMVVELFKSLPEKLGVEPDLVSYNTLVKAFCDMKSYDSATMLLDEMEKKGINPDAITFNTLLYAYYWNGKFEEGEKIWTRMLSKNVVPDIRSYNAKLEGLAVKKKTNEAIELIEEMRSKTVEPDTFSFNSVFKCYVNDGNLEELKQWYDDMEKTGCEVNRGTFGILVPFLCEKGDLEFALKLCKEIFSKRYLVNEELLQGVVDSLVKESRIEEAEELVSLGKTNKYRRYKLKLPAQE